MRRRPVHRPRWQHSDGHPYDEFDLRFTRFVDEADVASGPRGLRSRVRFSRLRALLGFGHGSGADRSQIRK
ncbi:MAG: hypothetical protein H0W87_00305 [Actinobacteria bacterium]|nr:hypothetical protein [Actinomycetota bacterium]